MVQEDPDYSFKLKIKRRKTLQSQTISAGYEVPEAARFARGGTIHLVKRSSGAMELALVLAEVHNLGVHLTEHTGKKFQTVEISNRLDHVPDRAASTVCAVRRKVDRTP